MMNTMLRIFGLKPESSCSSKSSCVVPNPTSEGNRLDRTNGSCNPPLRRRVRPLPSEVDDNFSFVTDISRHGDPVEDKKVVFQQLTPSLPSLVKHYSSSEEEEKESESSESLNLRQNKEEEDDRQKLKIMWVEALYDAVAADTFIDEEELERKARTAEELAQLMLLEDSMYDGVAADTFIDEEELERKARAAEELAQLMMLEDSMYDGVAADTFIDEEELERKARAAEELAQLMLLEDSMELTKTLYGGAGGGKGEVGPNKAESMIVTVETLQQKVKRLLEEKRSLALDLACEIRSRMAERYVANEAFKLIQKEKNALQSSLEKELDRRSSEWKNKQEKIKFSEKRLRDRVRDLAEQNVALQREVSHMKNKETNLKSQLIESELYMDRLNRKLKDADNEIAQLRQALTESEIGKEEAGDILQSIKRGYDAKGRESYAFNKSFSRPQWLLKDHEKIINRSLWNAGLKGDINIDMPQKNNGHLTALLQQKELIRVSGSADQHALCKDKLAECKRTKSYHERLRQEENAYCLQGCRLRSRREKCTGNGLHCWMNLDEELCAWLDELQTQSLLLFDENSLLCSKLLETLKYRSNTAVVNEQNKNNAVLVNEHEMNVQMLERKAYIFKESVNMVKGILKEKTLLACDEALRRDMNGKIDSALQLENQYWELSELQEELKTQNLISRLVREKLCSRDLEVEQLKEDVAMFLRNRELSKAEIKRMQNRLCSASHKVADLESQLRGKEEITSGLEADLHKCLKQIEALEEGLVKVSSDRDITREEGERLGFEAMRLNAEVEASQNTIEKLEEDVMIKNGQISIFRESLQELMASSDGHFFNMH